MRRHVISALAVGTFCVLAFGSGNSTPSPVTVSYDGPSKTNLGEEFPFKIRVTNEGEAAFVMEEVRVDGDLVRAITPKLPSAGVAQDFGDEQRYSLTPVTIQPAGSSVLEFEGTPFLDGQSGYIKVCDASGTCYSGRVSSSVTGGPDTALVTRWTVPTGAVAGQPAVVVAEVSNVSGGTETLTSMGWDSTVDKAMSLQSTQPPNSGEASELLYEARSFNLVLEPGDVTKVEFTATPSAAGTIKGKFATCMSSEAFCESEVLSFEVK